MRTGTASGRENFKTLKQNTFMNLHAKCSDVSDVYTMYLNTQITIDNLQINSEL